MTLVVDILQNIRSGIIGMMPDVGNELHRVETALEDIMEEMGQTAGVLFDLQPRRAHAEKIIREAATIDENMMKTRLPESPSRAFQEGLLVNKSHRDADE